MDLIDNLGIPQRPKLEGILTRRRKPGSFYAQNIIVHLFVMSQLYYQHPMRYETLIRRAYASGKESYSFFMESLIAFESIPTLVELYEIQLGKVKTYLEKALNKFLKLDLEEDERAGLIRLKEDLETAYTSSKISDVVIRGLGLTERFKPD